MNWFKLLKWILQIIVTVFLLFVTFQKLDVGRLREIFSEINIILILVVPIFLFIDLFLNSYRNFRLYRLYDVETRLFRILLIRFYSLFFTLIFPFLGDVYKIQAFKNAYGASYGKNTLVVVLDKLIHTFALVLLVAPFLALGQIDSDFHLSPYLWVLLVVMMIMIFIMNKPGIISFIFENLKKITKHAGKIQFHYSKRSDYYPEIFLNIFISAIRHIVIGFLHVVIAYAIFHHLDFNIFHFMLIVFLIMVAQVIPLSVGGIGLREYIAVMIFPAIGISSESAFIIAFILSSIVILQGIIGGITFLTVQLLKIKVK